MANRYRDIVAAFVKLGLTSFGGPIAHLGYLRAELVQKRRWLDEAHFADLVALCQFLPGPTSSQVGFALGLRRGGLFGGLLAWVCFTAPSAALMIAFAMGLGALPGAGWLHGLALAAVAVVAHAVVGMSRAICTDGPRIAIAVVATALLLAVSHPALPLAVLAAGAIAGALVIRPAPTPPGAPVAPGGRRWTVLALVVVVGLLLVLPVLARTTADPIVARVDSCYRAGALVFGGGHVVLPLLRTDFVGHGWLDDPTFFGGYSAAQALPGPLFAFAGFIGAASLPGPLAVLGGLACIAAIFLPGLVLVGAALPVWDRLRAHQRTRAALAGTNAAVVGVLLAALVTPITSESVQGVADGIAAAAALGLLLVRVPTWLVVAALAAAGQWLLPG